MDENYTLEKILHSESCRSSLLFFWLPTRFQVTNKRLLVESKNTILGILPIGHRSENISYRNIATVQSSSKLHIFRFLIGLWLFTSSFRLIISSDFYQLGIIEFLIGFFLLIHCFKSKLKIVSNSGKNTEIEVPFIESRKIQRVSREVNNQVIT